MQMMNPFYLLPVNSESNNAEKNIDRHCFFFVVIVCMCAIRSAFGWFSSGVHVGSVTSTILDNLIRKNVIQLVSSFQWLNANVGLTIW